jgi:hypothetical protein
MDIAFVPGKGYNQQGLQIRGFVYQDNRPNLNGIQFLDELKQFNIDWRVVNGVLSIERKDFFTGSEWFNTDNLETDQLLSICYESLDDRPAAYAEYMYAKDGLIIQVMRLSKNGLTAL